MKLDVSVIVPTLNEEKTIGACLKSIHLQETDLRYEIIVCDGKSEDNTVDVAGEYANKIVTSDVRSVGVQRNLGASKAEGRLLLFVDADTILPPDYLKKGVGKFRGEPKLLGFSAGFVFSEKSRRLVFAEKVTNAYLEFRDRGGSATLPGFNVFVKKSAFDAVGGFMDVPLEDIDFSIRLRGMGETRYYTDFHVITSSRRLTEMGLLGTLKYYFEMDLMRDHPNLSRLLTYNKYVECRPDTVALQKEFARISGQMVSVSELDDKIRRYVLERIDKLIDLTRKEVSARKMWVKTTKGELVNDLVAASKAIADLEFKVRVDTGIVDRALEHVQERFKRK